jgi:hypothetical protein
MTLAPTMTAGRGQQDMGRKRTAPGVDDGFGRAAIPSRRRSSMKSTRMIELRTMIPAPAMKPIIDVAVKNAPSIA